MPKTRRYLVPDGPGWTGGLAGGRIYPVSGPKPWCASFTAPGTATPKLVRTFKSKRRANAWRVKHSNKTGRTMNRWRFRPGDPSTVEMVVGPAHIVLYDANMHAQFSDMLWCLSANNRVYTTGRTVVANTSSGRKIRPAINTTMRELSMSWFVLGDTMRAPRRRTAVANGIIDNRLNNFISLSELRRGVKRGPYKKREKAAA